MFSRPGKMLAFAMITVVLSFLATLWFAQRRLDVVDEEIDELLTNANPSIEAASDARSQLRRLVMQAHEYVESRGADRAALAATLDRLIGLRDAQSALPHFAGERALTERADAAIAPLGDAVDAVIAAVDAGDVARARRLLVGPFATAVERADAAMDALVDFNGAHAHDRIHAIRHARDSANDLGSILGAASVVLAAATTLLVFRALRRYARIAAERDRLLEARASEMEAFAYRVAHDLRGPLAGMALRLTASDGDPGIPERIQATHAKLRARVRHMSLLIDGLLDFARAGTARESCDGVADVAAVVDDVVHDVQPQAHAAGVALSVDRMPDGAHVACSAGVLSSVLSNLVRNAIKYVGVAERTLRRVAISAQPRNGCLRLVIVDNGPGIARDAQARIFRPFVRASNSAVDGIGLGLATVERLVTAHGGRVGVRSEPGVGSTFWVELPLAPRNGGRPPIVALEGGRS
ncbi:MAG: sensory transduction histidine kinase [bacterium]|nr:sensory transduction histidine kinase [bacterium]